MTKRLISAGLLAALYLVFLAWYDGWGADAMSTAEAESYLAKLPADFEGTAFIDSMRKLAAEDDGGEIFMLNLNRYQYAEDEEPVGIPAAYQAYGNSVIGMILSNAGHPIYSGQVAGQFQTDSHANNRWDEIILVRYRSRRDFLSMIASDAFQQAAQIRAGGIAYAEVTPNTSAINLSTPRTIVLFPILILGFLIDRLIRRKEAR